MIQRIQSVFLLCVAIVAALMFFMPVATITVPGSGVYDFYTAKVVTVGAESEFVARNWMSLILNILLVVCPLVTIFIRRGGKSVKPTLFLQLRLAFVNIILLLGMIVLMWLQVAQRANEMQAEWDVRVCFAFPIVALILMWLAIRGIIKDLALLKSYDRLR